MLTCVQTSSTMSTCIININNDNDNDNDPPLPLHLNSDNNNNNNGCYPDHHDHPYHQQHRQQQKGSRRVTSQAFRYVFLLFSSFKYTTNKYIHFRLLTTTQWQPYPTQLSCKGLIGWRNGRGKGWGSRRDLSRAPGMFFFFFSFGIY